MQDYGCQFLVLFVALPSDIGHIIMTLLDIDTSMHKNFALNKNFQHPQAYLLYIIFSMFST